MCLFVLVIYLLALNFNVALAAVKEGPSLCKSLKSLKSDPSPAITQQEIELKVDTSIPIQISWINFDGHIDLKSEFLKRGQSWGQISYYNHWWFFTDKAIRCLAIYSTQTLAKMKKLDDQALGIVGGKK